jgi:hypothetical protein
MLSPEAVKLLDDNDYNLSQDKASFSWRYTGIDSCFFFIIVILLIIAGSFFLLSNFLPGIQVGLIFLASAAILYYTAKKSILFASSFKFDTTTRIFEYRKANRRVREHIDKAEDIYAYSRFIAEYASPFKSTSREYQHTIEIQMRAGWILEILTVKGDYREPPEGFEEIYRILKGDNQKT